MGSSRLLGVIALLVLVPRPGHASVEGTAPTQIATFRLFGSHSATGAALMVPGPFQAEINSVLLSSATAQITDIPFDGVVEGAYLFWSGSQPRTSRSGAGDGPDFDVDFTTADGSTYNNLSVFTDPTGLGRCVTTANLGGFYYCRRDVTDEVRAQGPGNANGIYTVGDVRADAGTLNTLDAQRINAQAKYAGWSLLIVWRAASVQVRRDVVLYDGFLRLDEDLTSGVNSFGVSGFLVGNPALGKLTVFGMEGDRQLGVPPEDSTGCPTCYDFISFRRAGAASATKLFDGANPANNSFNSSWNGQPSIDIDTYNLSGLINSGDTAATVTVGSGDGSAVSGGGESFFVGWVIVTLDTLTPIFTGTQTKKTVAPIAGGAGQTLFYSIDVVNEGSLTATSVTLTDAIPNGATYVSGTTRVDGVPRSDVAGASPLVGGLSLGTIPNAANGDNTRQISFSVRVNDDVCTGAVQNRATLTSPEIDPVVIGPATTTISAAVLDVPEKSVTFLSSGPPGPGSVFSYTIRLDNTGTAPAGGIAVRDTLPEHMIVSSVIVPSGASFGLVGNALSVDDISVPSGGHSDVLIFGRVRTVSELLTAGIVEDNIDGTTISNQGVVSGGCSPNQDTDDPSTPAPDDPTSFKLVYSPILTTSQKTVLDVNGAPLEPGDTLRFTIDVRNTGNRVADVTVTDAIPANTTYVAGSTRLDGAAVGDVGGTSALVGGFNLPSLSFVGDNDRRLVFDVVVSLAALNGAVVQNSAALRVPVQPSANVTVTSPALTVLATPKFTTSTKTVVDLGPAPFVPGDDVEYTVTVANTGNRTATNVVVTDDLPVSLTTPTAAGATITGNRVVFNLGTLATGASTTRTIRARIVKPLDDGTIVSNTAVITSAEGATFTTPAATFEVESSPLLSVTLVDEHTSLPPRPGQSVTYRLRISNSGTMTARDLNVQDTYPAELEGMAAPAGQVTGQVISWDATSEPLLAAIAPGEVVELLASARIVTPLVNGTAVSNQATASVVGLSSVSSDDPDSPGVGDATVFNVVSQATVTLTKTVTDLSPGTAPLPGDVVRYTLRVSASGDAPLTGVAVQDDLGAQAPQLTNINPTGGALIGGVLTFSSSTGSSGLASLSPGTTVDLRFDATIAAGTADGTVIQNQAGLSSPVATPALSDDPGQPGTSDPTRLIVSAQTNLDLLATKAVTDLSGTVITTAHPGDDVRYSVTLENRGNATALNVVVTDALDAALQPLSATGGTVSGQNVTFATSGVPALASLAPGQSVTLVLQARLRVGLNNGQVIDNQARVSASNLVTPLLTDGNPSTPAIDPTRLTVISDADLRTSTKVFKNAATDTVISSGRPGDSVRVEITLINTGTTTATTVNVRDAFDTARFTNIVPRDGGSVAAEVVTWQIASVAPGVPVRLRVDAQLRSPQSPGTAINQAFIGLAGQPPTVPTDDPSKPGSSDPTELQVDAAPQLETSTKDVVSGSRIVDAGNNVRYRIAVHNTGNAPAQGLVVRDVLAAPLTFVSATGGGTFSAPTSTVTWNLGTLAAAATTNIELEAQVPITAINGTVINNQAVLVAQGVPDALSDDPLAAVVNQPTPITVRGAPQFASFVKTVQNLTSATPGVVRPGDRLEYTLTLRIGGNAAATNVEVRDLIDTASLDDLQPVTPFDLQGNEVVFNSAEVPALASLAPGQSVDLVFTAKVQDGVDAGTVIRNQGFVSSNESASPLASDGNPATPGIDTTDVVVSFPDIVAVKVFVDLNGGDPEPGDVIRFGIVVANFGTVGVNNLVVRDVLDPAVDLISAPAANVNGATLLWGFQTLAPGGQEAVVADVQIPAGTPNGTLIQNQAEISAPGIATVRSDWPDAPGSADPVQVVVVSLPSFVNATKTVASPADLVKPGDALTYAIEITNDGSGVGTNVKVEDTVDDHLEVVEVLDGGSQAGSALSWTLGDVQPGAGAVVRFVARVKDETANRTRVSNQARVVAAELAEPSLTDDPSTAAIDDPTTVEVVAEPRLASSTLSVLDVNGGEVEPGDKLRYTLVVRNDGTARALETIARLSLPPYTSYLSGTARLNGFSLPGDSWPFGGGIAVRSARSGTIDGVVYADDETAPPDEQAVLVFDLTVDWRVVWGTTISLQALLDAAQTPTTPSDNPTTPTVTGDATVVVVGGGPSLGVEKRAELVVDTSNNGKPDIGDVLRYAVVVSNAGDSPARAAVLDDVIPPGTTYVASSMRLDSQALSDGNDGDGGDKLGDRVHVELGDLAPAAGRVVTFDVRIDRGPTVTNQATVSDVGHAWLSDADPTLSGAQPTVTIIDARAQVARLVLEVADENGGSVEPEDLLRYELTVLNDGAAVTDALVQLPFSGPLTGLAVVDLDGGTLEAGALPSVRFAGFATGERHHITITASVAATAHVGDVIEAQGTGLLDGTGWASDRVRVLVGSGVGSGGFAGRLFRDRGDRDGLFDAAVDEIVSGFSVMAVNEAELESSAGRDRVDASVATRVAVPAIDGTYHLGGLPPGFYHLWAVSNEGTVFDDSGRLEVRPGEGPTQDFALDPSGVVYQEQNDVARPIPGARVFLVDIDTDEDLPLNALGAGQQGQVTTSQGFYKFDVRSSVLPGRFRIRLESPSPALLFPSAIRPPTGSSSDEPLGSFAVAGPDGRVVQADFPNPTGDTSYFLRFELSDQEYFNNHIPLDRLDQRIRISKSVNKRTASIGEIVTYTVTIANPTDQTLDIDANGVGGAVLVDDLPSEVEWVEGSGVLVVERGGRRESSRPLAVAQRSARQLRFEPFVLPAESTVTLRYYGVIGIRAKGEQTNRVRLFLGNTPISEEATATLRIVDDPIFDQGTVLGRVFCDGGDGELNRTDAGVPGVRLYLDTGTYVDTDIEGKFHFRGVTPGRRALKLDVASLMPGARVVSDVLRDFLLTPGLLTKIDFAVTCPWEQVQPSEVGSPGTELEFAL